MVVGKVAVDIVPGLIPADTDILRQGEFGDAVDDAEIHRLGVSSLQGGHPVRRNAEDLACGGGVDILPFAEGALHGLVVSDVGQYPQLDLAVVRVYQHTAGTGHKHLADFRPQVRADRNILQIGVCRGKSSGCRHQILEGGVDAAIGGDDLHQTVGIGAFELREHPVIHNGRDNGVLVLQLFQNIGIGGIAGFRLLGGGQPQLFKQQHPQLLGGLDIKGAIGIAINQGLAVRNPGFQHFSKLGQLVFVDGNAPALHPVEHGAQGQLDLPVEGSLPLPFQLLFQRLPQKPDAFGTGGGIPILHGSAQEGGGQLGNGIVGLGGV